jgi:death-on-curing family protein
MADLYSIRKPIIEEKQHREFCELVSAQFSPAEVVSMHDQVGETAVFDVRVNGEAQQHLFLTSLAPTNHDYESLIAVNQQARSLFEEDGVYGVKFGEQLKSMSYRSTYPPVGVEKPMTIVERAAFYWFEIATHQAFHNGNKRTSFLAAISYLEMNGYRFNTGVITEEDLYQITLAVARGSYTVEELEGLLRKNTRVEVIGMELGGSINV